MGLKRAGTGRWGLKRAGGVDGAEEGRNREMGFEEGGRWGTEPYEDGEEAALGLPCECDVVSVREQRRLRACVRRYDHAWLSPHRAPRPPPFLLEYVWGAPVVVLGPVSSSELSAYLVGPHGDGASAERRERAPVRRWHELHRRRCRCMSCSSVRGGVGGGDGGGGGAVLEEQLRAAARPRPRHRRHHSKETEKRGGERALRTAMRTTRTTRTRRKDEGRRTKEEGPRRKDEGGRTRTRAVLGAKPPLLERERESRRERERAQERTAQERERAGHREREREQERTEVRVELCPLLPCPLLLSSPSPLSSRALALYLGPSPVPEGGRCCRCRRCCRRAMNYRPRAGAGKPPERGSFPLDHTGKDEREREGRGRGRGRGKERAREGEGEEGEKKGSSMRGGLRSRRGRGGGILVAGEPAVLDRSPLNAELRAAVLPGCRAEG